MKAILMSIRPEYVADILNGEKTVEIRKTMPKCELPIDVYIYATKRQNLVLGDNFYGDWITEYTITRGWSKEDVERIWGNLSGKVVAKFTLRKVEKIDCETYSSNDSYQFRHEYFPEKSTEDEILRKSCISGLEPYLDGCEGYAWHISDIVIFDEPKELSEFKRCTEKTCIYGKCHKYMHCLKPLTKAPQSFCYVEVEE